MKKREMDLSKITQVAKWFDAEYASTELISIKPGPTVHVKHPGLSEIAPIEDWAWELIGRDDDDIPWEASVTVDGICFFALFTDGERSEIEYPRDTGGELTIDK